MPTRVPYIGMPTIAKIHKRKKDGCKKKSTTRAFATRAKNLLYA